MATQTELRLSYSVGRKTNTGNYENVDLHVSESETWDVTDIDDDIVQQLSAARYAALKERVDTKLIESIEELTG